MVLGIPYTQQVQQFLAQYFTDFTGFYGLLALVPLVIFYLTRPKPREITMPSMMFFIKHKKAGKLKQAIRFLQNNLLLLLHVLFIIVAASALAEPVIPTDTSSDQVVAVIDVSASMQDDLGSAREFLKDRLGEENTVIQVGEDIDVPLEKASASQAGRVIDSMEVKDVRTDISTALETAANYRGNVIVASDLDQTVSDSNVREALNSLQNQGRDVAVMEAEDSNKWGITDLDIGRGNATADVQNFMDQKAEVEVRTEKYSEELNLEPGEVVSVTFPVDPGKNSFRLEDDAVESDNKAFISVPREEEFKVAFIADQRDFYFEKAVELIDFTSIERYRPPVKEKMDADVYVVGRTEELLSTTIKDIEDQVREGKSVVVFNQPGIIERFESLPVKERGGVFRGAVEITQPQRIWVDNVSLPEIKKTRGEAVATHNSVVKAKYGQGKAVFYGIADTDFKYNFLYPVFWKHVFNDITGRPTVQELNLRTGEELEEKATGPDGELEEGETIRKAGFYSSGNRVYSANLLSEDESNQDQVEFKGGESLGEASGERPVQKYVSLLLVALAVLEFLYLLYGGVL
ncbi:MAG: BatA domain-containing protein [Candidatus Nanohaloarchaea archaeon]|nr:BatA domain-containing protein [Candidatus Nanohaloarchaea archaeon]